MNAIPVQSNRRLNPIRSVIHLSGIIVILLREYFGLHFTIGLIATTSILFLISEILRSMKKGSPLAKLTLVASRETEKNAFVVKPLFYAIGIASSLLLFPKNIGYAAIVILTVGDGLAGIIGTMLGRIENPLNPSKTVEGTFIGFTSAFLIALILIPPEIAFIGTVTGAVVESLDKSIDDNVSVPLLSGFVMLLPTLSA